MCKRALLQSGFSCKKFFFQRTGEVGHFSFLAFSHFYSETWLMKCWKNCNLINSFYFFNISSFLGDRERQSVSGGGTEREGDTESETGSRRRAVSPEPNVGLKSTDCEIMTWVEAWSSTDWATQVPHVIPILNHGRHQLFFLSMYMNILFTWNNFDSIHHHSGWYATSKLLGWKMETKLTIKCEFI